ASAASATGCASRATGCASRATGCAERAVAASSVPASTASATSSQPASRTPCAVDSAPKPNATGRNANQDSELTPDATPERIADGTASCSTALTWIAARPVSRDTVTWAAVTTTSPVSAVSSSAATVIAAAAAQAFAGRSSRSRPASSPPNPSVETSPAQYGPYAAAGTASATSHSGPNSNTSWLITATSTPRVTIGSSDPRRLTARTVSRRCRRSATGSAARCSVGSRNSAYPPIETSANGTVRKQVARG